MSDTQTKQCSVLWRWHDHAGNLISLRTEEGLAAFYAKQGYRVALTRNLIDLTV
jgi:hypothetical protein